MFGGRHELLIGVIGVLVIHLLIVTGGDRDSLLMLSWPPLIALDAPLHPLVSGCG
jgi:hypothetical protein